MPKKIFVHRHKWSHRKRSDECYKLWKEGKLRKVSTNKDGTLYEEINPANSER